VLRVSHPIAPTPEHAALFDYITHEAIGDKLPAIVAGLELAKRADTEAQIVEAINKYGLTHEMIPNQWKKSPLVWEALLERMPLMAMVRNLGVMTANGLIGQMSEASRAIISRLHDERRIKNARVHPVAFLNALRTYGKGKGFRGSLAWTPDHNITDALEDAFYLAFENIEPSGKRLMLALDVSGSMGWESLSTLNLSARDAAAVMALATAKTESQYMSMAFQTDFTPFRISKNDSIDSVIYKMSWLKFGGTNCSLPMIYATANGINIDTFVLYTDSETWAGRIQPVEALAQYRQASGINAKLIVVGMTSNGFTIADPDDAGMLDVVGFDSATPRLISDFAAG
jgi:60 kDa SS-A/Ro ribonucleoprotein